MIILRISCGYFNCAPIPHLSLGISQQSIARCWKPFIPSILTALERLPLLRDVDHFRTNRSFTVPTANDHDPGKFPSSFHMMPKCAHRFVRFRRLRAALTGLFALLYWRSAFASEVAMTRNRFGETALSSTIPQTRTRGIWMAMSPIADASAVLGSSRAATRRSDLSLARPRLRFQAFLLSLMELCPPAVVMSRPLSARSHRRDSTVSPQKQSKVSTLLVRPSFQVIVTSM
jgi:hypothetical protein